MLSSAAALRQFCQAFSQRHRLEQAVYILWTVLLLGVCARSFVSPKIHSVYPIFSYAGQDWTEGRDVYKMTRWASEGIDQYRYSPLVTVWFVPTT